jgi:hypothetical protein
MSDSFLVLGPVLFQDFEIPGHIGFGGSQRLAIHRLPGGLRVIDAMGRDDAEIGWSGIFTGADATLRARLLDQLRAAGSKLPLSWDAFFYSVILSRFEADYTRTNWIPYRITCTVIVDEAAAAADAVVSLGIAALADLTSASGFTTGVDLSGPLAALDQADAATFATADYTTAVAAVGAAATTLSGGVTNFGDVLAANRLASAADLGTAADQAGTLANLTAAQGYVQRAATNLQNAST